MPIKPATPPIRDQTVPPPQPLSPRESYNIVTDTVSGPNIRWKDNLFQAVAIFACTVIGAIVGLIVTAPRDRIGGALIGAFIGVLGGLFGSGIFLMIFRAICHAQGKHD